MRTTGTTFQSGADDHVRNIAIDLVLTVITFGLFNLYVQYRQIKAINFILREEKYSFLRWAFFTLITIGLYHLYHEFRKSSDLVDCTPNANSVEPVASLLLSAFGLHVVADALQQVHINQYFGSRRV